MQNKHELCVKALLELYPESSQMNVLDKNGFGKSALTDVSYLQHLPSQSLRSRGGCAAVLVSAVRVVCMGMHLLRRNINTHRVDHRLPKIGTLKREHSRSSSDETLA